MLEFCEKHLLILREFCDILIKNNTLTGGKYGTFKKKNR